MDILRLKRILKLQENPNWAMRAPDQEVVQPPQAPAPIKQGGIPTPASAKPSPKPGKMDTQALKKAADSMLMGEQPQGAADPSAVPGQEGAGSTLSNALRMRRLSRQSAQQAPGSIGYMTGGM